MSGGSISTATPLSRVAPRSTASPVVAIYEAAEAAAEAIERLVTAGFDVQTAPAIR